MAGFFLVCPKRVFWLLKFVQWHLKNDLEVAEICEFLVVSAVSSCILSPSEGISGFPGFRVAGAIPGIFSGKSNILWVRTAKEALCLEGTCGYVRSYLISLLGYTPGSIWSRDGD